MIVGSNTIMQTTSPYVGPKPFEREDRLKFFGRDREQEELFSLVISSPAVLLYAQSGAGKTSLINAGVLPVLEKEGFIILPVARVRGLIPKTVPLQNISNIFIFNTLLSWAHKDVAPQALIHKSLTDYLGEKLQATDNKNTHPCLIIFDQFEELFTTYQDHWRERVDFFRQIESALKKHSQVRLLFVMREEYIAQLQPFLYYLPDKLRVRYRLECLKKKAALKAIKNPLQHSNRHFRESAAEKLVDNLLTTRVESVDGRIISAQGEYVEPVQLQVVCESLWSALPDSVSEITEQQLKDFGDVNQALQQFYEKSLHGIAEIIQIEEGTLRNWFGSKLITAVGTRGTVYRDINKTAGIPNSAVDLLESVHLVRGEYRGGVRWYELTHDRFIEPIQKSNADWRSAQSTIEQDRQRIEQQSQRWRNSNKNPQLLLTEKETNKGEAWIASGFLDDKNDASLISFITASRAHIERERAEAKARAALRLRRIARALVVATILLLLSAGATAKLAQRANQERKRAQENAQQANIERVKAEEAEDKATENARLAKENERQAKIEKQNAVRAQLQAERQRDLYEIEKSKAESSTSLAKEQSLRAQEEKDRAETLRILAERRKDRVDELNQLGSIPLVLADEAIRQRQRKQYELSALLAVQAYKFDLVTGETFQDAVFDALRTTVNSPRFQRYGKLGGPRSLIAHKNWVRGLAFRPNDNRLVSVSDDGTARLWSSLNGDAKSHILIDQKAKIRAVAFHPSGLCLACGDEDRQIKLIDFRRVKADPVMLSGHSAAVCCLAFSPSGQVLFSSDTNSEVIFWQFNPKGRPTRTHRTYPSPVSCTAFISNQTLVVGTRSGLIFFQSVRFSPFKIIDIDWRKAHDGAVLSVALSPDGRTLATAGYDGTVKLWNISSLGIATAPFKILHGHQGPVNAVIFHPDQRILASGSSDKTVRLWMLDNLNNRPLILKDHDRWVFALAFSNDGNTIFAGTGDRTIFSWPSNSDFLAGVIEKEITRPLNRDQWQLYVGDTINYDKYAFLTRATARARNTSLAMR
jgi:hypothetical protein